MLQALFQRNVVSEEFCAWSLLQNFFSSNFSCEDHFSCWNDRCHAIFWSILSLKNFCYLLGFVDRSFWDVFWADIVLYETLLCAQSAFLASTKDYFTMISCYFYDVILLSVTLLCFPVTFLGGCACVCFVSLGLLFVLVDVMALGWRFWKYFLAACLYFRCHVWFVSTFSVRFWNADCVKHVRWFCARLFFFRTLQNFRTSHISVAELCAFSKPVHWGNVVLSFFTWACLF